MHGFLLSCLVLMISASTYAQQFSVNFLDSVQLVLPLKSENLSATVDSTQYFFTSFYDSGKGHNRFFVRTRSLRDQQISSNEIVVERGQFEDMRILVGTEIFNNQAYALISRTQKERKAKSGTHKLFAHPMNTRAEVDDEGVLLMELPIEKVLRDGRMFTATSKNGAYLAALGVHPNPQKKDGLSELIVYDTDFYPIGKVSIHLGNIRGTKLFLHVSDQARAYISVVKQTIKNKTIIDVYEFDVNDPESVTMHTAPILDSERILSYTFKVLPNGDFWVIGTLEDVDIVSIGERRIEKFFVYRVTISGDELVINPIDLPPLDFHFTDVLVSNNIAYVCGEELIQNLPGDGFQFTYQTTSQDIHGNEYVIGLDLEGTKRFENILEQYYFIENGAAETYRGGYHLFGDNLIAIYHDESMFQGELEENNRTIPVLTMITPEGRVARNIPFLDELSLPLGMLIFPILSQIDGSTITTFMRSRYGMQMIEIQLGEAPE